MPEATDPGSRGQEKSLEDVLSEMIWGYRNSQAIFVAVGLGITDLLKDEARSSEELAAKAGVDPQALYRLLVVLASAGVVREAGPTRFALTPMGALLQKQKTLRDSAILAASFWPAYGELLYTIQTGRSGFQRASGMPIYDYLAKTPEADAAYSARLTAATSAMAAALTTSYDFSGASTVVDVGGGQGALLLAILRAHPHLRGILFDRSPVVAGALADRDVAERCEVVAGNFFEGVPAGGDVYILKWVISEWSDDRAVAILKNCRRSMTARGRVLVIDPFDVYSHALFNLQMLVVWNGGRVRSQADIAALFAAASLSAERIIPTQSQFSIVEGRLA
jgi:hypothetical protein